MSARGRGPALAHPRSFLGFYMIAGAALYPYRGPCEPELPTENDTPGLKEYRARQSALRAYLLSLKIKAEHPTLARAADECAFPDAGIEFDALVAELVQKKIANDAQRVKSAASAASSADVARARRARLIVGVSLLAAGKQYADAYGSAAKSLHEGVPNFTKKRLTAAKREVNREIDRFLVANHSWFNRHFLPDSAQYAGVPLGIFALAGGLMVEARMAWRIYQHFEPRLMACGTDRAATEAKITKAIASGELYEIALTVENEPTGGQGEQELIFAANWMSLEYLLGRMHVKACEGAGVEQTKVYVPKHKNAGLSIPAVMFGELDHIGIVGAKNVG